MAPKKDMEPSAARQLFAKLPSDLRQAIFHQATESERRRQAAYDTRMLYDQPAPTGFFHRNAYTDAVRDWEQLGLPTNDFPHEHPMWDSLLGRQGFQRTTPRVVASPTGAFGFEPLAWWKDPLDEATRALAPRRGVVPFGQVIQPNNEGPGPEQLD